MIPYLNRVYFYFLNSLFIVQYQPLVVVKWFKKTNMCVRR